MNQQKDGGPVRTRQRKDARFHESSHLRVVVFVLDVGKSDSAINIDSNRLEFFDQLQQRFKVVLVAQGQEFCREKCDREVIRRG